MYTYNKNKELTQGGILKDLMVFYFSDSDKRIEQISLQYAVVVSQACDISQSDNDNGYLPNIMMLPMYALDSFQIGNHLQDCGYPIRQRNINAEEIRKLKENSHNNRYHFLPKDDAYLMHDLIIDFKHYYTLPKELIISQYKDKYVVTIDYLHRELLSQRFCNYLSRIALPPKE